MALKDFDEDSAIEFLIRKILYDDVGSLTRRQFTIVFLLRFLHSRIFFRKVKKGFDGTIFCIISQYQYPEYECLLHNASDLLPSFYWNDFYTHYPINPKKSKHEIPNKPD